MSSAEHLVARESKRSRGPPSPAHVDVLLYSVYDQSLICKSFILNPHSKWSDTF